MRCNNSVPRSSHLPAVHGLCYFKKNPKSVKGKLRAAMHVYRVEQGDASNRDKGLKGLADMDKIPKNDNCNISIFQFIKKNSNASACVGKQIWMDV